MRPPDRILVFHTAFIGDIVLTIPLIQVLRSRFPTAQITFVAIPLASEVLHHHPALNDIIVYDKKGSDVGLSGIRSLAARLHSGRFDVAIVPHRSIRSALIVWLARIPRRIGFSTSAGRYLFTDVVPDDRQSHEIMRNLSLLGPLGDGIPHMELPSLYPQQSDRLIIDQLLQGRQTTHPKFDQGRMIAIAPGSVWNTKRWLKENFISLCSQLLGAGCSIVLVGGPEDERLCGEIEAGLDDARILSLAGRLTLLQSAELIRRCRVTVSNDSAPMHIAVAMRTPVVALFGATVPQFGFAPQGKYDQIVEIKDLPCRPCSIHGSDKCPIKTFDCMTRMAPEMVFKMVQSILTGIGA